MAQYKEEIIKALRETKRAGIEDVIKMLEMGDFFTAPASTKYHSSHVGGLSEHSWYVYNLFKSKNKILKLNISEDSIAICGLLHDVCKINFYTDSTRNTKENGEWVQKSYYTVKDMFPVGHGIKSWIMLSDLISLTHFEIIAIIWHMGFTVPQQEWLSMQNAFNAYPAAVALHTSDLEATYIIETRNENKNDNGNKIHETRK